MLYSLLIFHHFGTWFCVRKLVKNIIVWNQSTKHILQILSRWCFGDRISNSRWRIFRMGKLARRKHLGPCWKCSIRSRGMLLITICFANHSLSIGKLFIWQHSSWQVYGNLLIIMKQCLMQFSNLSLTETELVQSCSITASDF